MKKYFYKFFIALVAVLLLFSQNGKALGGEGVVPVQVVKTENGFQLLRGGKPYFIKGVGGSVSLNLLAGMGGNSFRTWSASQLGDDLEHAEAHGLTVSAGIWLSHSGPGFRYDNADAVRAQFEASKAVVEKYKDSQALLVWAFGNEMEGGDKTDPNMWRAIEDLAKMSHEIDPNHPTMTVIADIGGDKIASINKYCPDIDIVGVNSYGPALTIPERYKADGGVKPYIVTEFGPPGVWELAKNSWGASSELTSSQKADVYTDIYRKSIANRPNCLGSYAFIWGWKQEATPTWFGILLPDGSHLAAADALSKEWTGSRVKYPVPVIKSFKINGPDQIAPGEGVNASLDVKSPFGDDITASWKLMSDPLVPASGGAPEPEPDLISGAVASSDLKGAHVVMPDAPGAYRLYVYIYDRQGGAAVANIAIEVKELH
jgi:hypothetical protein